MSEKFYQDLEKISTKEIEKILLTQDIAEVRLLPLRIGESHLDWKTAQDSCLRLAHHNDEEVRANAALGLAYIARTSGKLEKYAIKPVLLELLKNCEVYRWRIIDAIEDIQIFMGWQIGTKAIKRLGKDEVIDD